MGELSNVYCIWLHTASNNYDDHDNDDDTHVEMCAAIAAKILENVHNRSFAWKNPR